MPPTPAPGINFVVWLIVLVAVGFVMMVLFKLAVWWGERPPIAPRVRSYPLPSRASYTVFNDDEPEPLGSFEIPLLNHEEPQANRSENAAELYLNAAEVIALHRMIEHNKTAAKPSKSSTIQAGFGVSRGGSTAYQRASLIYDALFGAPAPAITYRERSPEQEALRKQLKLY